MTYQELINELKKRPELLNKKVLIRDGDKGDEFHPLESVLDKKGYYSKWPKDEPPGENYLFLEIDTGSVLYEEDINDYLKA